MKGYLYVEEDLLGKPNKTYVKRYFVSYRFCGLKWFTKEANDIKNTAYLQCISNDTCGWVYGGSILVESVDTEKEIPHKDHAIYPFVVHLRCGEHETSIRLASKSEELRSKWVDEINLSMKIMTFVSACVQNDVLPHPAIFDAVRDNVEDDMTLTVGPLTARHLSAMLNYYSVCSPHGLMLHSFILENTHVADALVPYIAAVLQMAPYVGVVSLAQNLLTSAGVVALCDALGSCKYITDINLSGNFLFDACADLLARSLGELTDLRVLNLSHNYFTKAAVHAFTLRLATHRSKLTSVNFAHNALGDGIAVFVALLCSNQPCVLQEFDISFCGVGDAGATELAAALVKCKTLQQGKLHGAYLGVNAMQALVRAQADHHVAYQARGRRPGEVRTGLSLSFGGIAQGCTEALCLSLKALKTSLMYVADVAHVRGAVFRRRLLYKQPLEHETTADDLINPLHMLQHELQRLAQEAYPVAHLTVRLPAYLRNGYEVLEELALYLRCDPGQLVLLSCTATVTNTVGTAKADQAASANQPSSSKPNKTGNKTGQATDREAGRVLYSLVFTVLETPLNRATVRRNNSYMHSFPQVMGTTTQRIVEASVRRASALSSAAGSVIGAGHQVPAQGQGHGQGPQAGARQLTSTTNALFGGGGRDLPEQALYRAACLRSASEVLVSLHEGAAESHPFLRALGVRRVALKYPNPRFLEAAHEPEYVAFHCVIRGAGTKGGGLSDHYLPVLYPRMLTQAESNANYDASFEDTDDDEVFDTSVRTKPTPASSTTTAAGVPRSAAGAMAPVPEEEDDDLDTELRFVIASEEQMLTTLQLRQRRQLNEKLITAVRQLYAERELSSLQAKFWEGAFGHLKHKHVTQAGLKQALHRETGTFTAVYLRQQLYEAMFHRDLTLMNQLIGELQSRGTAQGGLALVYALRLRSEILGLQRTFQDITELARSYGELNMVEDFLLSCGKLGYSGPEMFQAVELRQELVAQGVKQRRKSVHTDLPLVKHKALISNLLISREMGAIEDKLDELRGAAASATANAAAPSATPPAHELLHVPECVAAEELFQEYEHTLVQVKSAIKTRQPDQLDQALAQAAYGFFYFEEVSRAVNVLNDISNNPAELLWPVVEALRANDITGLDETFERIRNVGWMHPAMDSAVCTKINDRQNKITEDEIIKSRLIKFCLAIKNGFKVNANEMMQLLRRAYKLKLDVDPVMSAYLKTVSKSVKQFAGVLKQEKYVQQLIDTNDIPVLAKLLAGRGSGKLVMCCPSAYVQDEWIHYLQNCCDGRYKSTLAEADGTAKEAEVFYTGTLEKAARNDQGLVRGWRQRFFQLNATALSYFTKPRGERKGVIRVIGGGVRRMDPAETGGRPFCIELEEGRDISLIDPDLLAEARKHVLQAKTREFEIAVRKGIALKSLDLLTRMLRFAEESEIVLDYGLVNEAKACITSLKEKNLKRDLRFAAKLVPRSQLDELIALAEKLSLDPNIPSYRTVLALAAKSEVEQHMIRARGALEVHDEALFARAFFAISRFDLGLLTTRQRCQLAALILQHSGYHALARSTRGAPLSGVTHLTKHALSCCLQLMVETEPMDLSRLLVALAYRVVTVERNSSYVSHAFFPVADLRGDKAASIAVYLDDMDLGHSHSAQYDITKYKQLRISSVYRYKGLGITAALQKGKRRKGDRTTDIMRYSTVPLLKSLLKYDPSTAVNARLHLEAFSILLAIMGDKPINSLGRPAKGTVLQTRSMTLGSLVLDIVDAAVNRYPIMANELYFQLAKQLTDNPSKRSWVRGWLLMTVYLHSFLPSADAVPYLKNFVDTSVKAAADELALLLRMLQTADASAQSGAPSPAKSATSPLGAAPQQGQVSPTGATGVAGVSEEDISALKYCSKIMAYCSALVSRIEVILHNRKAARHDTTSAPVLYKPLVASTAATHARENSNDLAPNLSAPLVERAYDQKGLDFEIAMMTGTVVKFSLPYGQCSTPFSVLLYLYDKLLPEDAYFERTDYSFQQSEEALTGGNETTTSDSVAAVVGGATSSYLSPEMKVHRVLSMFRGFALYSLQEGEYNDERTDIDLHRLPVQPDHAQCLDWTKDLQWDLLQLHTSEEQGTEVDLAAGAFAFSNTLLLRRKTSMLHEEFADEFELFQDQVSDRDVTALHDLWTRWLSAEGFATLPHDHVRVDLLYAEDTRYVNSRLYPLSEESFTYLLAMQLALCWVDGEVTEWAEIDQEVMVNCSISVRPCYKFPPQHLIDAPLASNPRKAVTAAEALEQYAGDAHGDDAAHGAQNGAKGGDAQAEGSEDSSDEEYEERRSEYSASTGTSSEYVSTVASEAPTPEPVVLTPLTAASALSESDLALLHSLIALVGVAPDTVQMDRLIQRIVQFHGIALKANIPVSSPKYRYLMKRAYIHYLSSASSFYGNHFAEAVHVPEPNHSTSKHRAESLASHNRTADGKKGKKGKNRGRGQHSESDEDSDGRNADKEPSDVLVAVSVGALTLLDPETWNVRFTCPIWDIQDFSVIISESGRQLLVFNINGMDLALEGEKVHEILDTVDGCCREALGRGYFPYGSDASCVTLETQALAQHATQADGAASDRDEESVLHLTNSKKIFKTFLHTFPLLPRPPIPDVAARSAEGFIPTPKSQRDLFAKERAEEERVEHEISRAAAEAQLERNQRQIQQGRENMKKYQTANKTAEEGEGSDASDAEEGTATRRQSALARSRRKNNRSVFGDFNTTEELRAQARQERISSLACGVSMRADSKFADFKIPVAPSRVGGTVKLVTSNDKKRTLRRPVILESRGLSEVLERGPVRSSLNNDAAPTPALLIAPPNGGMKGKKGSFTASFADPLERQSEATLLAWSNDRLQSALLEHFTSVTMRFHQHAEYIQEQWHRSTELLEANTPATQAMADASQLSPDPAPQDGGADYAAEEGEDRPRLAESAFQPPGRDPYLYGLNHYLKRKKRPQGAAAEGHKTAVTH